MENLRTYNIHALLVIGGFEVRLLILGHCGCCCTPGPEVWPQTRTLGWGSQRVRAVKCGVGLGFLTL